MKMTMKQQCSDTGMGKSVTLALGHPHMSSG